MAGDGCFAAPLVAARAEHAEAIMTQLGHTPGATLVVEPCARNTAPAIALTAGLLPSRESMLVCPSGHQIADSAAFRAAALEAASKS
jgi:mannose-1-phosphate guanylyltransferase